MELPFYAIAIPELIRKLPHPHKKYLKAYDVVTIIGYSEHRLEDGSRILAFELEGLSKVFIEEVGKYIPMAFSASFFDYVSPNEYAEIQNAIRIARTGRIN